MNKLFLLLIITVLAISSCAPETENRILLLKVDYLTSAFEGGKELSMHDNNYQADSLPLTIDYKSPGDFGSITLYFQPTGQRIFDGTIVWMGCGEMNYPASLNDASEFSSISNPVAMPDSTGFQIVHEIYPADFDKSSLWDAVSKLDIVRRYMEAGNKVGIFLYSPSVGVGDPADWDYFLIFRK